MVDSPYHRNGNGSHAPLRPRKVLFFGKTKARTCCTAALVHALRAQGLEVHWLNCSFLKRYFGAIGMRMIARAVLRRFAPDLCFVFYHDLPRDLMAEFAKEIPTVVWMEELTETDERHLSYVRDVRLLCLSTPRLVEEYRAGGVADTTFMLSGFSPRYHAPAELRGPRVYDRDIAFIGGPGHMGDRPEFLAWLAQHHEVEIFGRAESWLRCSTCAAIRSSASAARSGRTATARSAPAARSSSGSTRTTTRRTTSATGCS
jgi:hypothetical protein